jgi:molecular chaperone GrpE
MTEEERKYKEELERNGKGAIEIDENLAGAGNDLQAFADELGEHEKSKKKKFFGKFGGKGDGKAQKEIKELEEKIAKLDEQIKLKDEKIAELEGNVKSLVAENRNQKTRIENEFRSKIKFAVEDFFKDFITVKDDFDKAMEFVPKDDGEKNPFIQGIIHLGAKFDNICNKHGLVCISSIGEKFDPAIHQAMSMINVDGKEANEIVAEYVKCYKLHDRVIRPAMVVVASGIPATKPEEPKAEEQTEAVEAEEENKVEEQPETNAENTENVSETAENNEGNGNC